MKSELQNYRLAATSLKEDLFTGNESFRILKVSLILVFSLSIMWGCFLIFSFINRENISDGFSVPIKHSSVLEDKKRLETMAQTYKNILNIRKDSQKLANDIIRVNRNPLAKVEAPVDIPILSPEPSLSDLEELPPLIIVRAVMFYSGRGSAVLDIDGVGDGVVVKNGTRFYGGKGKILNIKKGQLIFRWKGKRVIVPIDL